MRRFFYYKWHFNFNCFLLPFSQLLSIFSLLDIDPVSVTPAQPQVVMLGDKVNWQCKTKASAAHTLQWKKVCPIVFSTFPPFSFHGKVLHF